MTKEDIEKAYANAIKNKELKNLELTKEARYNYTHRPKSIAKKLEILWMLNKIKLVDEPIG